MVFGLVLPLVLLVALAVVSAFDLGEAFIFNPLGLILILHTIFLTVIGIIVVIVSAKSYLRQGSTAPVVVVTIGSKSCGAVRPDIDEEERLIFPGELT